MKYFVLHLLLLNLFFTTNTASKKSLTWAPDLVTENIIEKRSFAGIRQNQDMVIIINYAIQVFQNFLFQIAIRQILH